LTRSTVPGNKPLDACARGYHMASRFELLDPSLFDYDSGLGVTADDAGPGPPGAAGGDSAAVSGWMRTGGASRYSNSAGTATAADTNCATWSSNSPQAFGTVAHLASGFAAAVWEGAAQRCDEPSHVWCVQDPAARELPEPRRRHRGRGGEPDPDETP
jgi:hypothetical protein